MRLAVAVSIGKHQRHASTQASHRAVAMGGALARIHDAEETLRVDDLAATLKHGAGDWYPGGRRRERGHVANRSGNDLEHPPLLARDLCAVK
jgi:hypothetical protein